MYPISFASYTYYMYIVQLLLCDIMMMSKHYLASQLLQNSFHFNTFYIFQQVNVNSFFFFSKEDKVIYPVPYYDLTFFLIRICEHHFNCTCNEWY